MGLTSKMEHFCQCVVKGMTYKDAYMTAYNSTGSEQAAYVEGSKLMGREDIQERIKSLQKPIEEATIKEVLSDRESKRKVIKDRIQACIDKGDDTNARGWMDILNKMDAEYININRNITDQDGELVHLDSDTLQKLSKMA